MNRLQVCPISVIQAATGARKEAVLNAARICRIPIRGNLLGGDVARFKLDFFALVEDEEKMLSAAEKRRNNRAAQGGPR